MRRCIALICLPPVALAAAPARSRCRRIPQVAGLQVALRAHGLYLAQIDGIAGPRTAAAVARVPARGTACRSASRTRARALALGPLGAAALRHADAEARRLRLGRLGAAVPAHPARRLLRRARRLHGEGDDRRAASRYQRADAPAAPTRWSGRGRCRRSCAAIAVPMSRAHRSWSTRRVVHVVRVGDTLTALAAKFHTTIAALAATNHIDPSKPIVIGQRLHLPVAAPSAPALTPQSLDVRGMLDQWSAAPRRGCPSRARARVDGVGLPDGVRLVRGCARRAADAADDPLTTSRPCSPAGRSRRRSTATSRSACSTSSTSCTCSAYGAPRPRRVVPGRARRAVHPGLYKITKPFVANALALRTRM